MKEIIEKLDMITRADNFNYYMQYIKDNDNRIYLPILEIEYPKIVKQYIGKNQAICFLLFLLYQPYS